MAVFNYLKVIAVWVLQSRFVSTNKLIYHFAMNNFLKQMLLLSALGIVYQSGAQVSKTISDLSDKVLMNNKKQLNFIDFKSNANITDGGFENFIQQTVLKDVDYKLKKVRSENDEMGMTHSRFAIYYKNTVIDNALIISHIKDGKVESVNGDLFTIQKPVNQVVLTEATALQNALKKVNAKSYMWQNAAEEKAMKEAFNDPNFTYYPKGEVVICPKIVKDEAVSFHYAYKFNIYASDPLYRANVFVDAQTGAIIDEQSLICTVDVPSTATTKYSGVRNFVTDNNVAGNYRLRETGRGNGIETYNMNNGTSYGAAVDFNNASTNWNAVNNDQAARDAHWGTEMVYDYFFNAHNRNSIDNAGYKLLSYVHYKNAYNNAFWDGQRMTYGDGDNITYTIFTGLDVCGHEIGHGLINKAANLSYGYTESGALHEGFADIWGTTVENYARPSQWDWLMGADITMNGAGIRNMKNPKSLKQPDCYQQTFWSGVGEPHCNDGPCIYWYYLLCAGGTGINDLGNNYNISAITMAKAAKIAYRALTVYFTPNTKYADCRNHTIQAAIDLYGKCSNEEKQVTNAWYAVGVGGPYAFTMNTDFTSLKHTFCNAPANVTFTNLTTNSSAWFWDFGDGSTSNLEHPAHTYTAAGVYHVKLKAIGCMGYIADSITKVSYVQIYNPLTFVSAPSNTMMCEGESVQVSANVTGGSGVLSYSWSPSIGLNVPVGAYNILNPNVSTQYWVTVSDAACPTETIASNFLLTVNPLPKPNITFSKAEGCVPLCLNLDAGYTSAAKSVVWNLGNGAKKEGANIYYCYEKDGVFTPTVNIESIYGCKSSTGASSVIKAFPLPGIDFWYDNNYLTDNNNVVNFTATSKGGKNILWSWDFGDPAVTNDVSKLKNPTYKFDNVGTFSVVLTATNEYGCADMAIHEFVVAEDADIFVPNAFTPNGDGFNDVFQAKGSGFKVDQFEMMIFDRNGVMVYKTTDVQKGWDGSYKGSKAASGVYVYKLKYVTAGGQKKEVSGSVTVL